MVLIRLAKSWQISENEVTSESVYFNRRRFLQGLIGAGIAGSSLLLTACGKSSSSEALEKSLQLPKIEGFSKNPQFLTVNRPIAAETVAINLI